MTDAMVTGRNRIVVLAVSAVLGTVGLAAVAAAGGAQDAPVEAGIAAEGVGADTGADPSATRDSDEPAARPSTTTTVPATTTTTAAPTTTTAPAPPPATPATAGSPAPTAPAAPAAPPAPPTTAAPAPAPPPPPAPAGPANGARNGGCERFMADQINAARARAGQPALAFDTGIQYVAVAWSDGMAGRQVLSHNPGYADQILRHRDYRTAGENVGRGYELGSLFQAFMDSPAHRANIEHGSYSHVTVGCLTDGSGQLWVTQNFWG